MIPSDARARAAIPFCRAQQPEQDVLGADVVVLERAGLVLREDHDLTRSLREALEHDARNVPRPGGTESACASRPSPSSSARSPSPMPRVRPADGSERVAYAGRQLSCNAGARRPGPIPSSNVSQFGALASERTVATR